MYCRTTTQRSNLDRQGPVSIDGSPDGARRFPSEEVYDRSDRGVEEGSVTRGPCDEVAHCPSRTVLSRTSCWRDEVWAYHPRGGSRPTRHHENLWGWGRPTPRRTQSKTGPGSARETTDDCTKRLVRSRPTPQTGFPRGNNDRRNRESSSEWSNHSPTSSVDEFPQVEVYVYDLPWEPSGPEVSI